MIRLGRCSVGAKPQWRRQQGCHGLVIKRAPQERPPALTIPLFGSPLDDAIRSKHVRRSGTIPPPPPLGLRGPPDYILFGCSTSAPPPQSANAAWDRLRVRLLARCNAPTLFKLLRSRDSQRQLHALVPVLLYGALEADDVPSPALMGYACGELQGFGRQVARLARK